MYVLYNISYTCTSLFFVTSVLLLFRLYYVRYYLKKGKKIQSITYSGDSDNLLCIIIPVYNEHKDIEACLDYFVNKLQPYMRLCFVFTQKEVKIRNDLISEVKEGRKKVKNLFGYFLKEDIQRLVNTYGEEATGIDLEDELGNAAYSWTINNFPKKIQKYNHVVEYHIYPDAYGYMADQINYGIARIREKYNDFSILIYNIDSKPDPNTFSEISRLIQVHKGKHFIIQQHSLYNVEHAIDSAALKGNWGSIIMAGACQWQNRWTLSFEVPWILIENKVRNIFWKWRENKCLWSIFKIIQPFNYCVGHGLCINSETLKKLNYRLPVEFWNEDAFLGYRLALMDIPVHTIPYFDITEITSKVKVYIQQQSVWFNGPLQAFSYWKFENNGNGIALLNATKLFMHAVYWLLGPLVWLCSLVISLLLIYSSTGIVKCFPFFYWIITTIIYGPIVSLYTQELCDAYFLKDVGAVSANHRSLTKLSARVKFSNSMLSTTAFVLFYPLHMIGPWRRIGQIALSLLPVKWSVGRTIEKYKTVRH